MNRWNPKWATTAMVGALALIALTAVATMNRGNLTTKVTEVAQGAIVDESQNAVEIAAIPLVPPQKENRNSVNPNYAGRSPDYTVSEVSVACELNSGRMALTIWQARKTRAA